MKTPITYYGGKQRLLKYILPLIPAHNLYAEAFTGGAAVFFAKTPAPVEVLNDTNKALITFYKVAKTDFKRLRSKIKQSLHSRITHKKAKLVYENPEFFNEVDVAWAVWMLATSSFSSILGGPFGYDKSKPITTKKFQNKKESFEPDLARRLEKVQIESLDACRLIKSRDTKSSFFYCDPPYFNSDMGHYKGYREGDFEELLQTLASIKGKFLLSSYPSPILEKYIRKYRWSTKRVNQYCSIGRGKRKLKVEVLTANYSFPPDA